MAYKNNPGSLSREISVARADGGGLIVAFPYHADVVTGLRKLGGVWREKEAHWRLHEENEAAARELLVRHFGTDGTTPLDLVTVCVLVVDRESAIVSLVDQGMLDALKNIKGVSSSGPAVRLFGRKLVVRDKFTGEIRYSRGVSFYKGFAFPRARKDGRVGGVGTVIRVRDVPRCEAERALAEYGPDVITLLEREREIKMDEEERVRQKVRDIETLLALPGVQDHFIQESLLPLLNEVAQTMPKVLTVNVTFDGQLGDEVKQAFMEALRERVRAKGGFLFSSYFSAQQDPGASSVGPVEALEGTEALEDTGALEDSDFEPSRD